MLAPAGAKVRQPLQLEYEYRYLLLAVEPLSGRLRWEWIERMKGEQIQPVLSSWELECVVWDGAPGHGGEIYEGLQTQRVALPPYSPELNPAERVFEEVRRWVEGEVYQSLEAKQWAVEEYLQGLAADPERVRRLCGWKWITEALNRLPPRRKAA